VIYGPQPLGGRDYPAAFGLSFQTLTLPEGEEYH
jgi:hypothetical protein